MILGRPENGNDVAPQSHHMPDRHVGWLKAGPGPHRQRPVGPAGEATRGANWRCATAWLRTSVAGGR